MGMYTGLRFKGVVKPEFRKDIALVTDYHDWDCADDERLREFDSVDRASFIPWGVLCYMPWDDYDHEFNRGYNRETGEWVFQCSLKNYGGTIAEFLSLIPNFAESVEHCEVLYETWDWSEGYELIDGEMKKTKPQFICYAE